MNLTNIPVTLYDNVTSTKGTKSNLETILKAVQQPSNTEIQKATDIRTAANSDTKQYNVLKSKQQCFSIGHFPKRKDEAIETYTPMLVFDIDHCTDVFDMSCYLSELKKIPYIFAAFPSLSGRGIRAMVWTDATTTTHKQHYEKICTDIGTALKIHIGRVAKDTANIDTSTSNIGRVWYMSSVIDSSEFYINENFETYLYAPPETPEAPEVIALAQSPTIPKKSGTAQILTFAEKTTILEKMTIQRNGTPEAGRNNFVLCLSCLFSEHGIVQASTIDFCSKYEAGGDNPFTMSEITKTVKSGYSKTVPKFSDAQLLRYFNNGAQPPAALPPPEPKKQPKKTAPEPTPEKYELTDFENVQDWEKKHLETQEAGTAKITQIIDYINKLIVLRYNEVSNEIEYSKKGENVYSVLNDSDLVLRMKYLGFKGIKDDFITLMTSSLVKRYDPFLNYFDSLPNWATHEKDHILHLASFIEVAPEERDFLNLMFKKHLVRSVMCALNGSFFNKQCLTLLGKQNDGKSTFVRFLCPEPLKPYYKDGIRFENKDADIALTENFIINLDELATFTKSDISRIKEVFSKEKVKSRRPYAKREETMTRRATFFASTNEEQFLTDTTGNVRWLVFHILGINHNYNNSEYNDSVNINDVWAQAYHLYKSGFKCEMTKTEIEQSEQRNKDHIIESNEIALIRELYEPATATDYKAIDNTDVIFLTVGAIKKSLEQMTKDKIQLLVLGKALRFLGFKEGIQRNKDRKDMPEKGFYLKKWNIL